MGEVDPGDRREEERKNECVEQWFMNKVVVLWSRAHIDKMEPATVAILLIALTPFFHNSNYFI